MGEYALHQYVIGDCLQGSPDLMLKYSYTNVKAVHVNLGHRL
jgi:hypothetical protein